MSQRRFAGRSVGFTLVELLVVIGIIAVLISILLPSLSRARDSANAVKCQSNMKQIYTGFVLYSQMYNNYCMPAQGNTGSSVTWYWLGSEMLGRAFGLKVIENANEIPDRLANMLDCPTNDRDKYTGYNFKFDYSYNSNLGDIRGQDPTNGSYASFAPAHKFKKWIDVPNNVAILVENSSPTQANDERFDTLAELTWKKYLAGSQHRNNTRGNVLFQDGTVRMIRLNNLSQIPGYNRPALNASGNVPSFPAKDYTELEDWMISHPGHMNTASVNRQAVTGSSHTINDVWQKGKPLPF